jgi:hypothetical protein
MSMMIGDIVFRVDGKVVVFHSIGDAPRDAEFIGDVVSAHDDPLVYVSAAIPDVVMLCNIVEKVANGNYKIPGLFKLSCLI